MFVVADDVFGCEIGGGGGGDWIGFDITPNNWFKLCAFERRLRLFAIIGGGDFPCGLLGLVEPGFGEVTITCLSLVEFTSCGGLAQPAADVGTL